MPERTKLKFKQRYNLSREWLLSLAMNAGSSGLEVIKPQGQILQAL